MEKEEEAWAGGFILPGGMKERWIDLLDLMDYSIRSDSKNKQMKKSRVLFLDFISI